MKLTKNIISRETALLIDPDYVAYVEGNIDKWETVLTKFAALKTQQHVITYCDGQFVAATIVSIDTNTFRGMDGPVVRVTNGEYSWRVDGDRYAAPV